MPLKGRFLQIVDVSAKSSYKLNEDELAKVLMRQDIRDLPVVVMSVAGACGGKSFLLNFFIRYLSAPLSARLNGTWLYENEELVKFPRCGGIQTTTVGILMWSEPFITSLPSGDKVAVVLMDTQGTFYGENIVRDWHTIFMVSTLLSSVQIYNLSCNIQEHDLQQLQLFTEYCHKVKDHGSKTVQTLTFLVRDWNYPKDYPYGEDGGKRWLDEMLQVTPDLPKEMQKLRQNICSCFQLSCFLMPHPGFEVLQNSFTGNNSDINVNFRLQLNNLTKLLFSPEKLITKTINGEEIKTWELFYFFKNYMGIYSSNEIPHAQIILNATVETCLQTTLIKANEISERGLASNIRLNLASGLIDKLQELHNIYLFAENQASFINKNQNSQEADDFIRKHLQTFNENYRQRELLNYLVHKPHNTALDISKAVNSNQSVNDGKAYKYILMQDTGDTFFEIRDKNRSKHNVSVLTAVKAYNEHMNNVWKKKKSKCLHPYDLEQEHKLGLRAALDVFRNENESTNEIHISDEDKTRLNMSLQKRIKELKKNNVQDNEIAVQEAYNLRRTHRAAKAEALKFFLNKRQLGRLIHPDIYRECLERRIEEYFQKKIITNFRSSHLGLLDLKKEY